MTESRVEQYYRVRQSTNGVMDYLLDHAPSNVAKDCFDTMSACMRPKQVLILDEVNVTVTDEDVRVVTSCETIGFLTYANSESAQKALARKQTEQKEKVARKSQPTKKGKKG